MSIKTFDSALDFLPSSRSGKHHSPKSMLITLVNAFIVARSARFEYNRQVSDGMKPADAVKFAFDRAEAQR